MEGEEKKSSSLEGRDDQKSEENDEKKSYFSEPNLRKGKEKAVNNKKKFSLDKLDGLSEVLLNIRMPKSKKMTMSNWENHPLSKIQVEYAADDAIMSYWVFATLMRCYMMDFDQMSKFVGKVMFALLTPLTKLDETA